MVQFIRRLFGRNRRAPSPSSKQQFAQLLLLQTDQARAFALDALTMAKLVTPTPLFQVQRFGQGLQVPDA